MKRRVICFFVLVFWGLIICTLLSESIEQQMTAQVVAVTATGFPEEKLPVDSLNSDDTGVHLYKVVEGSGWESGSRVQEVTPNEYRIEKGSILVTTGQGDNYIQYASKPIASGDLIQVTRQYQGQEGNYLVIGSTGTEMSTELWKDVSLVERNETALLLSMVGKQLYMEAQIRSALSIPEENQVYSLGDVNTFFENIPLVATLLVLMIVSVILWGYSCILSRNLRKNRFLLMGNLAIGVVLLGIFARVTHAIHLPSSLLPGDNIFKLNYYTYEFSEILGTLKGFSSTAASEVAEALKRNVLLAGGVVLLGIMSCIVILLVEQRMVKRRDHSPRTENKR